MANVAQPVGALAGIYGGDYFGELMKYEFDAKNKPSAMYRSGAKNYVSLDGDVRI